MFGATGCHTVHQRPERSSLVPPQFVQTRGHRREREPRATLHTYSTHRWSPTPWVLHAAPFTGWSTGKVLCSYKVDAFPQQGHQVHAKKTERGSDPRVETSAASSEQSNRMQQGSRWKRAVEAHIGSSHIKRPLITPKRSSTANLKSLPTKETSNYGVSESQVRSPRLATGLAFTAPRHLRFWNCLLRSLHLDCTSSCIATRGVGRTEVPRGSYSTTTCGILLVTCWR